VCGDERRAVSTRCLTDGWSRQSRQGGSAAQPWRWAGVIGRRARCVYGTDDRKICDSQMTGGWMDLAPYRGSSNSSARITPRASVLFKIGWLSLMIIGVAILVFGLIATWYPLRGDPPWLRSIGVASIGMGLFGLLITTIAYRRRERWAWFTLWYYPVFWTAHLVGGLPPGREHIHQIVFIVLSLAGLLLPVRDFFPRRGRPPAGS
jgi:hypothetical protein